MEKISVKISQQFKLAVVILFVVNIIFCSSVFGNNTIEKNDQVALKSEKGEPVLMAALDTEENQEDIKKDLDGNIKSAGSEDMKGNETGFIAKLGTFLFITSVLMFLLQWHRKKKDR